VGELLEEQEEGAEETFQETFQEDAPFVSEPTDTQDFID
jgi:hypothetical protein